MKHSITTSGTIRWLIAPTALTLLAGGVKAQQPLAKEFYEVSAELKSLATDAGCGFSFGSPGSPEIRLQCHISPRTKEFDLMWYARNAGHMIPHLQVEPLTYTPTAITSGSDLGVFYVGGTTKFGITKLVKYIYAPPELDDNGAPIDAELVSASVVYSAGTAAANRDIYHVILNEALANHAFVEFWSTKNILDVNLSDGTATMVVSSSPASGVLVVPQLLQPHNMVYAREHVTHGYVYFFTCTVPSSGSTGTPVLCDTDKDGDLDEALILTTATWQSMGFGTASQYVDH